MARRINQESTGHGVNELNERKRRVLWAVVQDYADTAEPVGSRTIARKYDLGVSSATIRNEMQDLEDEGYLEQPHTSAGRIPSIKGYRFYVDWLMQPAPVSSEEEHMIDHMLMDHVNRQEEIFRNMAKAVAVLTHTLSVAASAGQKKKFNYVRFLPLDGRRAILLVVTDQGDVSNAVVDIPKGSSFDEMQLLADKLNHFLHGREIDHTDEEMILSFQREVEKDLTPYLSVFQALQKAVSPQKEVYAGGASQLIEQPEFKNVEKMQDILNLLEQRDMLESMLLSSSDQPIAVHIGTENPMKSLSDLSVVRAQFTSGGRVIGSFSSFLLTNRKKPVSMPQVSNTKSKATHPYKFVTIPKSPVFVNTRVYIGTSIQFKKRPMILLIPYTAVSFASRFIPLAISLCF